MKGGFRQPGALRQLLQRPNRPLVHCPQHHERAAHRLNYGHILITLASAATNAKEEQIVPIFRCAESVAYSVAGGISPLYTELPFDICEHSIRWSSLHGR